jgi:hypothetical protein
MTRLLDCWSWLRVDTTFSWLAPFDGSTRPFGWCIAPLVELVANGNEVQKEIADGAYELLVSTIQ